MVYIINDLHKFALMIRDNAAKSFSETYTENLDDFISINQIIGLIKKYSIIDNLSQYNIGEDEINDLMDDVCDWIYGVGLAKLCGKDIVNCAWDSEVNHMIFWLNNNEKTPINSQPTKYEH